jgi:hypothetical protein
MYVWMRASLVFGILRGYDLYLAFFSLTVIDRCQVNMNILGPKSGVLQINLKQNGDYLEMVFTNFIKFR